MEAQYLANNLREQELTKHVSLALTQPMALVQLLQPGNCSITLDESLFDRDHPGHYFRRLRSVAVTIPCVTGPFTGVNATLALGSAVVRTVPRLGRLQALDLGQFGFEQRSSGSAPRRLPPRMPDHRHQQCARTMPACSRSTCTTSAGFRSKGQGAVSTWSLTLDRATTISTSPR